MKSISVIGLFSLMFSYNSKAANLCRYDVTTTEGAYAQLTFEPSGEWAGQETVACKEDETGKELQLRAGVQYFNQNLDGRLIFKANGLTVKSGVEFRFVPICPEFLSSPDTRVVPLPASNDLYMADFPRDIRLRRMFVQPFGTTCPDIRYKCTYDLRILVDGKELLNSATNTPSFPINPTKLQKEQDCYSHPHPQG